MWLAPTQETGRDKTDTIFIYWPIRHTVAVREEVMFAGDRIIPPRTMRTDMLQKLHIAHQGMQRTKALAR